jgi:histidinol dehydrogenase
MGWGTNGCEGKGMRIRHLSTREPDFWRRLESFLRWEGGGGPEIEQRVRGILNDVRQRGDRAILEHTARFDRVVATRVAELELSAEQLADAAANLSAEEHSALELAAERIRSYAEHQRLRSWSYREQDGTLLGQRVTPLDRVGLYVPGGKAAYPSSVLMNAIPAKVAGVAELLMVVPTPDGVCNELVLAAAHIAGADRVLRIGGAQAVAALAFGTESVPKVDKLVGPGNIYVATAKRMVFGFVGIDMVAGPSEIVVVCDGGTEPDWVAMDLFSQAEHDEDAQAILVSTDGDYLRRVEASLQRLLPSLERAQVVQASLGRRGAMIEARDLDEALEVVNFIAPEHLELSVAEPQRLLPALRHAGAIFLGRYTAEALGDYCAGPNHVLPTAGTARFASPLGVYDFQKRSSIIECSAAGAHRLGRVASRIARREGLTAHARSAEYRVREDVDEG